MKISKCIIAFVVAIAMVFALSPVGFASTDNTLTSDTTITLIDGSVLSVPEKAITGVFGGGVGSSTYIVHQVQEGFYYRFMIDTFARPAGVAELETLSWRRFISESFSSLEDALLSETWTYTDFTDVCYDPSTVLTIGRGSVDPVYSTFDYCDSFGNVIISDCNDDHLIDLTLNDGTVIRVPRSLVGNQFVVVRSASNSSQYKIWNFGTPDTLEGIYEGAEGVNYLTSVGTFIGSSPNAVLHFIYPTDAYEFDVDLSGSKIDFGQYPYVFCTATQYSTGYVNFNVYATSAPRTAFIDNTTLKVVYGSKSGYQASAQYMVSTGLTTWLSESFLIPNSRTASGLVANYGKTVFCNYPLYDSSGTLLFEPNFNFTYSSSDWEWSDWESSTAALALTFYGDIVYQTFDYPLTAPDDDTNIDPDTSDENLSWLQRIWKAIRNGFSSVISRLDRIIDLLNRGGDSGADSDCEHTYTSEIQREATCSTPGHMQYICGSCGHRYTELIEPVGHDWIVQEHVDEVLDEEGNVVEKGYDRVVCSVCKLETKDYGDGPVENDLFDAIGDLLAGAVDWILDKLAQLTDSLTAITDSFNSYIEQVKGMSGSFGLFFGDFLALLPEDLRSLMWFGVIAGVVGLVWKAWMK